MALIYQHDFDEFNSYKDSENDNDKELSGIAARYGTPDTPAADIRQEFWLMDFVRRHFGNMVFSGEKRLRGWCVVEMRYVRNRLFEITYPRHSQPGHPGRPTAYPGSHSNADEQKPFDLESDAPSPISQAELAEEFSDLKSAINELSNDLQKVVQMKQFQEKTFKTIGQELGISAGRASQLHREALQDLQRSLVPASDSVSALSGESK